MHCHLRPVLPSVVLSFNYTADCVNPSNELINESWTHCGGQRRVSELFKFNLVHNLWYTLAAGAESRTCDGYTKKAQQ